MVKLRVAFFAAAVGLVTLGFSTLAHFQAGQDDRDHRAHQAVIVARALAQVAAEAPDDETLQAFTAALPGAGIGVEAALVLKSNRLVAHHDPARAGQRLDSDSLADKALYDALGRVKATVGKNVEERERVPDMDRDAYPEVEVRTATTGFTAAAPVKSEGRFVSMAYVDVKADAPAARYPLLALVAAAVALVLFVGLARLPRAASLTTGVVLLAAVAMADVYALSDERDRLRRERAEWTAQTLAGLGRAGLLRAVPAERHDTLVPALALSADGQSGRDLVEVRSATIAGAPAIADATRIEVAPYEAWYAEAAFVEARRGDLNDLQKWAAGLALVGAALFVLGALGRITHGWRAVVAHRSAYGYLTPAMIGMAVLVFIPVVYGIVLGFLDRRYNVFEFAGLSNYIAILSDFDVTSPQSFYFKLGVTLLWTAANVGLHVGIGLFLALLLNDEMLKAKGIYRVLLVVPWAIPNYITALIWKGMFHKQFGAVNFFLEGMGVEPIAWFQSFWPAFATNLATNTWLGFPFMMVVSLGALQSIPADLYEAAFVDGASRWQRFRNITLPLLMPALVPAVIMGSVWTFNMFNIIYLVSGGAPDGATDILITDAFRWAFERDRYGYAAAYSTIIFVILLLFTLVTNRVTGATKGAFE